MPEEVVAALELRVAAGARHGLSPVVVLLGDEQHDAVAAGAREREEDWVRHAGGGRMRAAVERAVVIAKEKGAKRALLLPVSAPFHCALMAPAAAVMAEALSKVTINTPSVPVVANVVAEAVTDPAQIRALLVDQVTGSVRWRESVMWMGAQGVTEAYEIGAGKALSGMIKRIDRAIATQAVGTPDDVAAAAAALQ